VLFVRLGAETSSVSTPREYHVSLAAADGSGYTDVPHAKGDPEAQPHELAPASDGKSYFYLRDAGGLSTDDELHLATLDGASDRLLATFTSKDRLTDLVASSDGAHLAAAQTRGGSESFNPDHLVVLDLEGRILKDVGPGHHPAWSPDGKRLAFDAPAGKEKDGGLPLSKVATVDADGANPLDAGKPHPYISESALMWSSVGKILFVYEGYDHQYALWSVPAPS
jgi:dipeptidyl aminopeptidase/acylaminoacyl peptidase